MQLPILVFFFFVALVNINFFLWSHKSKNTLQSAPNAGPLNFWETEREHLAMHVALVSRKWSAWTWQLQITIEPHAYSPILGNAQNLWNKKLHMHFHLQRNNWIALMWCKQAALITLYRSNTHICISWYLQFKCLLNLHTMNEVSSVQVMKKRQLKRTQKQCIHWLWCKIAKWNGAGENTKPCPLTYNQQL